MGILQNRFAITLKVGDLPPYFDGMVVDGQDEMETGVALEDEYGYEARRVYCIMVVNRALKGYFQRATTPIYSSDLLNAEGAPIGEILYARSVFVKFDLIAQKLGIPDLVQRLRSTTDSVPIIDGTSLTLEDFYRYPDGMRGDLIPDLNSHSTGSFTVGTTGADFPTWVSACADIANLTGNLTYTQIDVTTETVGAALSKALAGYTLKFTSDTSPLGKFASGRITSISATTVHCFTLTVTAASASSFIIERLNIKKTGIASAAWVVFLLTGAATNGIITFRDSLINCDGKHGYCIDQAGGPINAYNIVNANALTAGLYLTANSASIFENITNRACVSGANANSKTGTFKNIASFGNTTADFSNTASLTAFTKCASGDANGSEAGLRSLTEANEMISTDITNANFMRVKGGGKCANGGAATGIAANTYGVRGNTRPRATSYYSIGADELNNAAALFQMMRSK
jgi:hypothetical protein